MMILQYTAAALASENKVLVHPASADSIPTSANQEDHVSMGPIAGRHALDVLANVARIIAIELLVGAQALDLRLATLATAGVGATLETAGGAPGAIPLPAPGRGVAEAHRRIRSVVAPLLVDREMGADIAAVLALVRRGELADLVDAPDDGRPEVG
jgi:histidine ammonia-lyase